MQKEILRDWSSPKRAHASVFNQTLNHIISPTFSITRLQVNIILIPLESSRLKSIALLHGELYS